VHEVLTGKAIGQLPVVPGTQTVLVREPRAYLLVTGARPGRLDRPGTQPREVQAIDMREGKTVWRRAIAGKPTAHLPGAREPPKKGRPGPRPDEPSSPLLERDRRQPHAIGAESAGDVRLIQRHRPLPARHHLALSRHLQPHPVRAEGHRLRPSGALAIRA